MKVHDTAEVSKKANIGEGTSIWNQAQIRENVIIGNNGGNKVIKLVKHYKI